MHRYEEGDIAVVICNTSDHGFAVDEKVRIKQVDWPIADAYIAESLTEPKHDWAIYYTEIKPQLS